MCGLVSPIHMPFALDYAISSRMRSAATSRSNWANDSSMFRVSRPMFGIKAAPDLLVGCLIALWPPQSRQHPLQHILRHSLVMCKGRQSATLRCSLTQISKNIVAHSNQLNLVEVAVQPLARAICSGERRASARRGPSERFSLNDDPSGTRAICGPSCLPTQARRRASQSSFHLESPSRERATFPTGARRRSAGETSSRLRSRCRRTRAASSTMRGLA